MGDMPKPPGPMPQGKGPGQPIGNMPAYTPPGQMPLGMQPGQLPQGITPQMLQQAQQGKGPQSPFNTPAQAGPAQVQNNNPGLMR